MSVKLSIDLEALQDPAVAQALTDLMTALGPEASAAVRSTTPVSLAPAGASRPRRTTLPVVMDVAQAYVEFVEGLSEKPRRFLELLRHRGRLRIDEAMAELGIEQPKAIGGITGAIGRWAPARGIPVPYAPIRIDGKRAWKWTGVDGLSDAPIDPTTRPPAAMPEPMTAPPPVAQPPAPSEAPAAAAPVLPPEPPAVEQAPAATEEQAPAAVPDLPADPNARFVRFITELPEQPQAFLRLVYERGELSMPDAVRHFGLARPRSVGKMTEPIRRLSQAWGLPMPYESERSEEGWRVWRWRGFD